MKRLVHLDRSVRVSFHAVLVGSIYLLFAGHNQPGGGFVAGLVAGASVALAYAAGGIDEVRALSRFRPWTILGVGLLLSATIATLSLLAGGQVLEASSASWDAPLMGTISVTSSLPFDIGVYLLVVGLVLMVFEAFGDDIPAEDGSTP